MIKRIISCLLITLLTLCLSVTAWAEVNLSEMSDDEILAFASQLDAEIVSRGLEKSATLPKGTYIAGQELPAGSYIFTCLAKGSDWGSVTVKTDEGKGDQLLWEVVEAPKEGEDADCFFIRLHDGDELKSGVPFSLAIVAGMLFS